jgi:hypothetical protein
MKFGGNTSFGPMMFQKKFENWGVFSKNGQNLRKFSNNVKSSILIGFSKIKFFLKI